MIDISIIVPVYNAENHITKCLNSIIQQSIEDIEIIVVDDGSIDNTREIIEQFKIRDNRIISIYQSNSGPGEARNAGIKIARGKYLGFVDSDDQVDRNMYMEMFKKAEQHNCDIVSCNYKKKYDDSTFSNSIYKITKSQVNLKEYGLDNFIKNDIVGHVFGSEVWSKLIRAEIIKGNNVFFKSHKEILGEDMLFLLECLLYTDSVIYINEPLYIHSVRKGSLTNSHIPNMSGRLLKLVSIYVNIAKSQKKYLYIEQAIPFLVYNYVGISIAYEKTLKGKYALLKEISNDDIFIYSTRKIVKTNDCSFSKKVFAFLCTCRFYYMATLYRSIIELMIGRA